MTKAEIAQLKENLTADYKRKLEALELVEQMLNQQQKANHLPALAARFNQPKPLPPPRLHALR